MEYFKLNYITNYICNCLKITTTNLKLEITKFGKNNYHVQVIKPIGLNQSFMFMFNSNKKIMKTAKMLKSISDTPIIQCVKDVIELTTKLI